MSATIALIENEMTPHDICIGIYESIRYFQKRKPSSTDNIQYRVINNSLEITVRNERYRGCRCYIDTTTETLLISDELLSAYEYYREHCQYWYSPEDGITEEERDYHIANYEFLISQFLIDSKNDITVTA